MESRRPEDVAVRDPVSRSSRPTTWFRRAVVLTRWVRKPLTVAQALVSVAGVGSVVLAASFMEQSEFARFALLNLAYNLTAGILRAGLFQPALIAGRRLGIAHIPL